MPTTVCVQTTNYYKIIPLLSTQTQPPVVHFSGCTSSLKIISKVSYRSSQPLAGTHDNIPTSRTEYSLQLSDMAHDDVLHSRLDVTLSNIISELEY